MPGSPTESTCRWSYTNVLKNVAIFMAALTVVGMIFSLLSGDIGGFFAGGLVGLILIIPFVIAAGPALVLGSMLRNVVACGTI